MYLEQAIKSKLPFKRPNSPTYIVDWAGNLRVYDKTKSGGAGDFAYIGNTENMFASDWEVVEEKVPISEKDLRFHIDQAQHKSQHYLTAVFIEKLVEEVFNK